jgi:hypothetical protein
LQLNDINEEQTQNKSISEPQLSKPVMPETTILTLSRSP